MTLVRGMAMKMATHTQADSLATSPKRMSSSSAPRAAGPMR